MKRTNPARPPPARRHPGRWYAAALLAMSACLACLAGSARAELTNEPLAGPAARSRPAYDGADAQVLDAVPVLRYFGAPWFARTTLDVLEAGLRTPLGTQWHAALQLAYEPGRRAGESAFLRMHHVADIPAGASAGAQLEWDRMLGPMPLNAVARLRQCACRDRGAQADLRLSAGILRVGPLSAGLYEQGTWADARSAAALYGVSAPEAISTGLPAYSAAGGLLFTATGLVWSVDLPGSWVMLGGAERRRLQADAARSPLTQRVADHTASVGVAYRF